MQSAASALMKSLLYSMKVTSPLSSEMSAEISFERLMLVSLDGLGEILKFASCRVTILESCSMLFKLIMNEEIIYYGVYNVNTDGIASLFVECAITNSFTLSV